MSLNAWLASCTILFYKHILFLFPYTDEWKRRILLHYYIVTMRVYIATRHSALQTVFCQYVNNLKSFILKFWILIFDMLLQHLKPNEKKKIVKPGPRLPIFVGLRPSLILTFKPEPDGVVNEWPVWAPPLLKKGAISPIYKGKQVASRRHYASKGVQSLISIIVKDCRQNNHKI